MTLWEWAVEVHGRPGVEALCLRLQDGHGQCVSYLLWAAWAAQKGCELGESEIAVAAETARDWEAQITQPLRSVRRALKSPRPGFAQTALRQRIQAEELAAERLLLEALEARTPAALADSAAAATTLITAAAAWNPPAPRDLLEALGLAFSNS